MDIAAGINLTLLENGKDLGEALTAEKLGEALDVLTESIRHSKPPNYLVLRWDGERWRAGLLVPS